MGRSVSCCDSFVSLLDRGFLSGSPPGVGATRASGAYEHGPGRTLSQVVLLIGPKTLVVLWAGTGPVSRSFFNLFPTVTDSFTPSLRPKGRVHPGLACGSSSWVLGDWPSRGPTGEEREKGTCECSMGIFVGSASAVWG